MPKLPAIRPRELVAKLKKLGFVEHHQVGSHLTMKHPTTGSRAVVPMHLKDVKKGTLSALLREARVARHEFLNA